jgi:hypothetical protein
VEFGIIPDGDAARRQIIFDPIPRVDGIDYQGTRGWILELRSILLTASNGVVPRPEESV